MSLFGCALANNLFVAGFAYVLPTLSTMSNRKFSLLFNCEEYSVVYEAKRCSEVHLCEIYMRLGIVFAIFYCTSTFRACTL